MKKITLFSFLLVGLTFNSNAQTFNATAGPIPDVVCTNFPITVSGIGVMSSVSIRQVSINLTHTFCADLDISLISPTGVTIDLTSDNGGGGDNYTNTIFSPTAAASITTGVAPFTGSFTPEQPFNTFAGVTANGAWTLRVCDDAAGDIGALISASISFNFSATAGPIPDLVCTNFPITVAGVGTMGAPNSLTACTINLTHTFCADLDISLISPTGVTVDLSSDNGGGGDNFTNTVFSPTATASITTGVAPFTGSFLPEQPFTAYAGVTANGAWTLRVCDDAAGDIGTLISATLAFGGTLATTTFETSNNLVGYPNPVKDILTLSNTQNIDKVQVINLLGQEVITRSMNATEAQIDMSNLSQGAYLVRVTSNNQVKTIKVIKE